LNQPGIARRPACSPSEYLATSHVVVTRTTTTATVPKSRQSAITTTASSYIPTAQDLGPPVRPSRPLTVSRSRAASTVASAPTIAIPQATYPTVDFEQLWSDLQDQQNQTWAHTGVSYFEAISPATSSAVAMATPSPAITQATVAPTTTPIRPAVRVTPNRSDRHLRTPRTLSRNRNRFHSRPLRTRPVVGRLLHSLDATALGHRASQSPRLQHVQRFASA